MPSSKVEKQQEIECGGSRHLEELMMMKKVVRRDESNNYTNSSSTVTRVIYGECQKNHAANIGGYAVDGCREFLASTGEEGTPTALTCACCGCHRSFHRRELQTELLTDSSSSN